MSRVPTTRILYLGDLLQREGLGPWTLATAIEAQGIQGLDRFMRWQSFLPDSDGARQALDLLAEHARVFYDLNPPGQQAYWTDSTQGEQLYCFGWPETSAPDFAAINAGLDVRPPKRISGAQKRHEDSLLSIVGALLLVSDGKAGTARNPAFSSETKLLEHVAEHFKGFNGMSLRNLKDKAAKAKRLFDA